MRLVELIDFTFGKRLSLLTVHALMTDLMISGFNLIRDKAGLTSHRRLHKLIRLWITRLWDRELTVAFIVFIHRHKNQRTPTGHLHRCNTATWRCSR